MLSLVCSRAGDELINAVTGLRLDGAEHVHRAGDVVVAPAGAPHAAWNAGEDTVHVLVDFRPALRTEVAFETLAGLRAEYPYRAGSEDPAPPVAHVASTARERSA